jgi:hypothetical protein
MRVLDVPIFGISTVFMKYKLVKSSFTRITCILNLNSKTSFILSYCQTQILIENMINILYFLFSSHKTLQRKAYRSLTSQNEILMFTKYSSPPKKIESNKNIYFISHKLCMNFMYNKRMCWSFLIVIYHIHTCTILGYKYKSSPLKY